MLNQIVQFLEQLVLTHGWWGLVLAAVAEEIIAPIPSAGIMTAGGLAFAQQPLTSASLGQFFLVVVLPVSVGVTLGSLCFYWIAKYYGHVFVERYGKFFGVSWTHIQRMEQFMQNGYADEFLFVFARIVPVVPSAAVSLVAGLFEWPTRKYILYTFCSTIVKTTLLGLLVWQAGAASKHLLEFDISENVLFLGVIVTLGMAWAIRKIIKHKMQNQ